LDNLPEEELYDLTEDPHEIKNLADDPAMAEVKNELRGKHEKWIRDSGDLGFEEKHPDHIKFFTKSLFQNDGFRAQRKFQQIRAQPMVRKASWISGSRSQRIRSLRN
jgi:hypothetical protein